MSNEKTHIQPQRTLVALGANKSSKIEEMMPPSPLASRPQDVAYVGAAERLEAFYGMSKADKEAFLKKENTTEEKWVKETKEMGDLFMSRYTLTFEEYDAYAQACNRRLPEDQGWGRARRPAVNINIVDAAEYCNWINVQRGLSPKYILANLNNEIWIWCYPGADKLAKDYIEEEEKALGRALSVQEKLDLVCAKCHQRIPTSTAWVACLNKPDEKFTYPGSDNLDEVAWYKDNSDNMTHPVGEKKPNSYGIYDMYGNVWEMCLPQEPPVMTEEIWKSNWKNIPYLDFSDESIFNTLQD